MKIFCQNYVILKGFALKNLLLSDAAHGAMPCRGGKMPAFIGLPGAREKTEIGRGLFERSEFRSPRRRAKREAGKPDNERATFLGYFFAAGKKFRNDVILNEA